ncbi:hypothetical protein MMPV_004118 [Pyropia vietnamensis]
MATRNVSTSALRRWLTALRYPFAADFDDIDVLSVHRLAHFLEDTHLRHLPESERSALFFPPSDGGAVAATPLATPADTAPPRTISADVATASLSAYVAALAPTYAGAPAVSRFYSAPAVAAWLTRTALSVAVADAAGAHDDDKDNATTGAEGPTAMDTATADPTASVAAAPSASKIAPAGEETDITGATKGGADAPPPPPVVAGAAAHPAVRAAAAAVVAACGLASPPGGSSAAAASAVAARHVLAWQATATADDTERGDAAASAAAPTTGDGAPLTLADFPSGLEVGDATVDAVGGVLRLLHAARLARVQRNINHALAVVQATTADAQTDNRLWGRGH